MVSKHEEFWTHERYAFVAHSTVKPFPALSYAAAKAKGKTVFPVDPSVAAVDGDKTFADLDALPEPVDGVVLEVPREETAAWIERAADAGVSRVWIHAGRDTPEALALAAERGLAVCSGTCAVQYLRGGFPHNVHRALRKLSGNW
jgi:predicted CoA-binding protein